ncbi:FAD-dependent monooxygenase [Leifsonia sp. F6_8S_P_1B]|uniref:FAD-dependent monooxygenase n=1 Tax=Leifsonia williamsii TaxID=3035919 RepID=A0ABT8KAV2_9MICO|nr:FAD-dependent monooxygenase [Leifsonia williamsii]MDN4614580.1 FAD-dependent monooxygenase [Leifsonia williamsii]
MADVVAADVLVVGAGPVGLTLAGDLARRGVRVRIIDNLPAPTTESRAIVLHSRSLDHLEAHGVVDEVLARGIVSTAMEFHAGGESIAEVAFGSIDAVYRHSVSLLQTDTERILADRLAEFSVEVERGVTLAGYQQDEEGVTATVQTHAGDPSTIRARYLVGADGARSTVRHLMGQKLEGDFAGEDFLLADVDGEHGYERAHFHTFLSPGETTALIFPLPEGRVRVMAELPPGTDPERAVTVEWVQQALADRGVELRITAAHWLTRFQLKHGQVARYRDRRVFLAGDAAHIHSPAGGLGMNTGIQDAMNLGWKLALALRAGGDDGAETLLDSYQSERYPVAAAVIAFSTRLSTLGTLKNPLAQRVRNAVLHAGAKLPPVQERLADEVEEQRVRYEGSPIVRGSGGRRGHALKPGDFLLLRDQHVAAALAQTTGHLVIELPGAGGAVEAGAAEAKAAKAAAVNAAVLPYVTGETTPLRLSEADAGRLADAAGLRDGGVVVVRPDGYVAYIGDAEEAPAAEASESAAVEAERR